MYFALKPEKELQMTISTAISIRQLDPNATPEEKAFDEAMAKMIDQKIEQFGDARKSTNLMVKANVAYLSGEQNIGVVNNHIVPLPSKYNTSVIMNRILPAVTNDIAVGTKSAPTYDIIPNTTDENDKKTAML